ncbi:hypothetical protein F511_34137 [Dorcoceras hygrometricum]|uniref:Uncharacterized protein n=1 Tax=Dorcoceras hygrometricum TaxID=472368 RepID=A0A2Z7D055_9LAMI|nr:hypothetical protein F511_34137 [Dorcoceras hygrometricum]
MTFRVVRTNQYNQDLRLIHSTNGNHLESSNEGSSIDHQVTIYLHAQNIKMFPTNETCRCARERMTNRRMEEPVARGMVLRLDEQLRVAILARCARERMTNRRMEEPVASGMVLRLDEQLRVAILA